MAANFQKLIIVGHLGADPEVRGMQNGDQVMGFSVAVTERWDGGRQEHTEWFRCSSFDQKSIPFIASALRKGDKVLVEGKLRTREWTDNAGVVRKITDVIAFNVQLLENPPEGAGRAASRAPDRGRDSRDSRPPPRDDRGPPDRRDDRRPPATQDRYAGRDAATRTPPRSNGYRDEYSRDSRPPPREAARSAPPVSWDVPRGDGPVDDDVIPF